MAVRRTLLGRTLHHITTNESTGAKVFFFINPMKGLVPASIIFEKACKGNLYDVLHDYSTPFTWPLNLRIALDITNGLAFLHSTPISTHF